MSLTFRLVVVSHLCKLSEDIIGSTSHEIKVLCIIFTNDHLLNRVSQRSSFLQNALSILDLHGIIALFNWDHVLCKLLRDCFIERVGIL